MEVKIILKNHLQPKYVNNIFCGYSISGIWTYDGIENNHEVCRGEDCMKKFCESLRERKMKFIKFGKKKIIPLTKEQYESYLAK